MAAQDGPRLNTPDWLWSAWTAAYGENTARRIAEAHLAEPPLDVTVRGEAGSWAARLEAEVLPTGSLRRRAGGLVTELPGYADGAWWIQDAAAALPARLLGDVNGKRVIDLCAAPGGKTAQLAAAGATVIAVEQSGSRRERLAENLARLKLEAELVAADAAVWRPGAPADAVLLDAPCSATGTIRRHPDLPWMKAPRGFPALVAAQDRLLANAAEMVKPGGVLVYAVCSLEPEEGPARIARFLGAHPDTALEPVSPAEIGGCAEFVAADGTVRTLPCHWPEQGGLDGFYIARLRRR
jgi:16S rRNA (cytosine967-C5)-methyltransferase